ncbi:MAG TPA: TonB family protein [Woeseiaceae bacterium]|nr:TonB family protein [Woeseiaceae bacterium]
MAETRPSLTKDMLPAVPATPDRLPPMLFLAALFHAVVILGVTFEAVPAGSSEATTLEVTIVADSNQHVDASDDADYLAQANQRGGGNTTEHVRPGARPRSAEARPFPEEIPGETPVESAPGETDPRTTVVSRSPSDRRDYAPEDTSPAPSAQQTTVQAAPPSDPRSLPLPVEEQANLLIHDDDPRHLVISADTRESRIAGYLDRWKRKVERVGTLNFPEQARTRGMEGSPVLEVAIDADGELTDIVVRRSSGHGLLDQAALNILRRAAPFDPFPEDLRKDYDELRFAYQWQFNQDGARPRIATRQ